MSRSNLAPRPPTHLGFKATLGAILGGGTAYALGCDGPTCAVSGSLAAVSVRIALIDLKMRIILDRDIVLMSAIGLAWVLWAGSEPLADLSSALLHGLGYAGLFQVIRIAYIGLRGRNGLGFGDVKLVGTAGPLLTVDAFAVTVAAAAIAGIIFALFRTRLKKRSQSRYAFIPFGSVFAISSNIMWFLNIL